MVGLRFKRITVASVLGIVSRRVRVGVGRLDRKPLQ